MDYLSSFIGEAGCLGFRSAGYACVLAGVTGL